MMDQWGSASASQQSAEEVVVDIRDLVVSFGAGGRCGRAVDGLSLQLRRNRTVALVGESGSGKSVTSLALMGLLPRGQSQCQGSILFRDRAGVVHDLLKLDASRLRALRGDQIAMIFQEPMTSLNPMHRVGDQIAEAIRLHRDIGRDEALRLAERMIARVGFPDPKARMAAYPHELSGGMRQRIMISMALVCEPAVLIADEPTTALDVTVQAQILEEMRRLQAEMAAAMLFITHDLGVVAQIAHDVAVIYAGQIVETGPVEAVLERPAHPYTRALLAAVPRPDRPRAARLQAIPGIVPDIHAMPNGCRFQPRCAAAATSCAERTPSLESIDRVRTVRCVRWQELNAA